MFGGMIKKQFSVFKNYILEFITLLGVILYFQFFQLKKKKVK